MSRALMTNIFIITASSAYAHGPDDGSGIGPWMMGPGMMGPGMMGPGMMGWGYGMGWLWMIVMFIFWVAVIAGIVFLIRWVIASTGHKVRTDIPEDSALEILRKRYVKGEINKEEFEEMKRDLQA